MSIGHSCGGEKRILRTGTACPDCGITVHEWTAAELAAQKARDAAAADALIASLGVP